MSAIPFKINVPDSVLEDLRRRLEATRWPRPAPVGGGWAYGADLDYMRGLVDYWLHRYDWRKEERTLNQFDQYKADVLVALCPMCQMNLDAFQGQMNGYFHTNYHMPILFFTQLMGLAFGLPAKQLGLNRNFVRMKPLPAAPCGLHAALAPACAFLLRKT